MGRNSGGVRNTLRESFRSYEDTAREKIEKVISDIRTQGYSRVEPFKIGGVEDRMKLFARENDITLGSDDVYMSYHSIAHTLRDSKVEEGVAVSASDLASFPISRSSMRLFYDKDAGDFVYTNGSEKYVVRPNYEIKISRNKTKVVNYITATKMIDDSEFGLRKYVEI